ncbi:MAG TPA: bifunctional alpha,alpha-trehalose-phosphate synthase (UDP-forming)/trehalose-phosphatase [Candidatus Binatia bacterium]
MPNRRTEEFTAPRRLVIVSNRLPFTVAETSDGVVFQESAGGVATGLRALLTRQTSPRIATEYMWLGWPGTTISAGLQETVKARAVSEFSCYPVFLSADDFENFYQGFCNKTIWPLFHYFPANARYQEDYWAQYRKVNEVFTAALLDALRPDDTVWIHDYHLMLLPEMLRSELPTVRIGFFLHIPFPQFEIFRFLPANWRRELLSGMLGSDLVGFHTHDDAEYFARCVQRLLGHEHRMGQIAMHDRFVSVGAFPMGIDFQKFHHAVNQPEVKAETEQLQTPLKPFKVVLSVDRQDYSKGILHRLEGFHTMLEKNPDWHGRVTLIMIVVPSRIGIENYEETKKQIEELVGKINGQFGTIGWVPIIYQYRSVPFESLVALYAIADVGLVTPLRDGMNLVAKEYVASRTRKNGVLVLSEMAGAAKELTDALIINPNDRAQIATALKTALEMPLAEQVRRNTAMQKILQERDVTWWATTFLAQLEGAGSNRRGRTGNWLSSPERCQLIDSFRRASRRLLILDYDGTLVNFATAPELARPTKRVLQILRRLCENSANEVVLVTGRDRTTLEQWFTGIRLGLAAEHGAILKKPQGEWRFARPVSRDWQESLLPILNTYVNRLPESFVEKKEFSLVFHYRTAEPDRARPIVRELRDFLLAFTANTELQVLRGSKIVEIKNGGISKDLAVRHWLAKDNFGFVVAIGDDSTDEDMFRSLPPSAYSIHVGTSASSARFNLPDAGDILDLLEELASVSASDELLASSLRRTEIFGYHGS